MKYLWLNITLLCRSILEVRDDAIVGGVPVGQNLLVEDCGSVSEPSGSNLGEAVQWRLLEGQDGAGSLDECECLIFGEVSVDKPVAVSMKEPASELFLEVGVLVALKDFSEDSLSVVVLLKHLRKKVESLPVWLGHGSTLEISE